LVLCKIGVLRMIGVLCKIGEAHARTEAAPADRAERLGLHGTCKSTAGGIPAEHSQSGTS